MQLDFSSHSKCGLNCLQKVPKFWQRRLDDLLKVLRAALIQDEFFRAKSSKIFISILGKNGLNLTKILSKNTPKPYNIKCL